MRILRPLALAACALLPGIPGAAAAEADEAEAVAAVKSGLPAGWTVTRTERGSVPDGWVTRRGGGLLVEGGDGKARFRTWFLPRDWIGVCPRAQEEVWRRYSFGVLLDPRWRAVTLSTDPEFPNRLWNKVGLTASLVNSGARLATEVFGAKAAETEAEARALVDSASLLPEDRMGAVSSLILLGVPAPSLFRETALTGTGQVRELCLYLLAEFGGPGSAEVLCKVVEDSAAEPGARKAAAFALERLADPASGPALLRGLERIRETEPSCAIAMALERIRWKDAAPLLLKRLRQEENPHYKVEYAKALASLRYAPAEKDLRALAGSVEFTAEWIREARESEYLGRVAGVALLRLSGPWGEPADGLRLLLLPPKTTAPGAVPAVALVVENCGDADRDVIACLEGTVFVDGAGHPLEIGCWDGFSTLRVNDLWVWTLDLGKPSPGPHRVRFDSGKARSNEIEVVVPEPPAGR